VSHNRRRVSLASTTLTEASGQSCRWSGMSNAKQTVGLIATGAARKFIAEVLSREGFTPLCFDRVQAVLDPRETDSTTAIVVCPPDAGSSIPALIEPLTKRLVPSPIVVVCVSIQRRELRGTLAAGAAGVALYDGLDRTLGPCLHAARTGQVCVPRGHWAQISPPVLSTREKQILGLVVMGYMNSQIAEQLFLAESTVKSHLSSAYGKLGVRSRNEAVELILNPERGLGMGILGLGGEPLQAPVSTELPTSAR
jgi:DNA-binding NarL/FixJ family response regulator